MAEVGCYHSESREHDLSVACYSFRIYPYSGFSSVVVDGDIEVAVIIGHGIGVPVERAAIVITLLRTGVGVVG